MSHLGRETTESIYDTESASLRRQKGNAMRATGRAHRLPTSAVGLECSDSPVKTREEHHASDLLRRSRPHCSLCREKEPRLLSTCPWGLARFVGNFRVALPSFNMYGKKKFADFCGPVGSGRVRSVCLGPVTLYICGFVFCRAPCSEPPCAQIMQRSRP